MQGSCGSSLYTLSSRLLLLLCALAVPCRGLRPSQSSSVHVDGGQQPLQAAIHNGYTAPGAVVWGCNTLTRGVALTFDDGPNPNTATLLKNLKLLGVKATFFVCGGATEHRDIVKRAFNEGHTIGHHTWSHVNLTWAYENDRARFEREILDTEELIKDITGQRPVLFRPPYGAISKDVRNYLAARNYTIVMWSGGCIDWWLNDMDQETPIMLNGMADAGSLLCMHDSSVSTCENIGRLVNLLVTAEPQTTANPQGRRILPMNECLDPTLAW